MLEVTRFVNSRFGSNTFILSHPEHDDVWVVDPGDTENVFEWMKVHSKTSIKGILLTHAHFDHIYGMNEIVLRYPECVVYISNEYGLNALHDPKINGSKYTEEGPFVLKGNTHLKFIPEKNIYGIESSFIQLKRQGIPQTLFLLYVRVIFLQVMHIFQE